MTNEYSEFLAPIFTLNNITIRDNVSTYSGGGISIFITNSAVINMTTMTIIDNKAEINGGGLSIMTRKLSTLSDIIISGNEALSSGGGIAIDGGDTEYWLDYSSNVSLNHVIINNNTGSNAGGGIFIDINTNTSLDHVTLYNNSSNVSDSTS